jgi:hypothetical protein
MRVRLLLRSCLRPIERYRDDHVFHDDDVCTPLSGLLDDSSRHSPLMQVLQATFGRQTVRRDDMVCVIEDPPALLPYGLDDRLPQRTPLECVIRGMLIDDLQ